MLSKSAENINPPLPLNKSPSYKYCFFTDSVVDPQKTEENTLSFQERNRSEHPSCKQSQSSETVAAGHLYTKEVPITLSEMWSLDSSIRGALNRALHRQNKIKKSPLVRLNWRGQDNLNSTVKGSSVNVKIGLLTLAPVGALYRNKEQNLISKLIKCNKKKPLLWLSISPASQGFIVTARAINFPFFIPPHIQKRPVRTNQSPQTTSLITRS